REERHGDLDAAEPIDLLVEVEAGTSAKQRAPAVEELAHGREPERHVRSRRGRRLDSEEAQRAGELVRVLRRELPLRLRRERGRSEAEEEAAALLEPLAEPARRLLGAAVLGEPPRKLLGGLLRLELGQLRVLLGEHRACLQLEERGDEDQ